MAVHIITNSFGSGDYIIVSVDRDIMFEGHSIRSSDLADILRNTRGISDIHHHNVDDEQMDRWTDLIN